jgi:hypothetical protein
MVVSYTPDTVSTRPSQTLPSVTVRSVSISLSFVSRSGVSSRKLIATCTILVMACLSCPCFFESWRICSSRRFQSPASLQIVMIATKDRDVEARSEDYFQSLSKLVMDVSDRALPVSLASPILIACRCPSGYLSGPNLAAKQLHRRGVVLTFAISCASGMTLSASLVKSFSGLKIFPSDMFGCGRGGFGHGKAGSQGRGHWTEGVSIRCNRFSEVFRLIAIRPLLADAAQKLYLYAWRCR